MKRYYTLLRRLTLTTLCALLCVTAALAQNRIDRKIDHRTGSGASNFTSVVKRNPDTRKVEKVVKVLTVGGWEANGFTDAFYAEAHTGSFTEKRDEATGSVTLLLTVSTAKAERIYMLEGRVPRPYAKEAKPYVGSAKITVIVVYKGGKG